MYRGADSSLKAGCGPPVVCTLAPPEHTQAQADYRFLQRLWTEHKDFGAVTCSIAFSLFSDPLRDSCRAEEGAANALPALDQDQLRSFLRRRIFDVWRGVLPSLCKVTGSFEIFNPANGANMGWHQDGYGPGIFIAHYALSEPTTERMCVSVSVRVCVRKPNCVPSPQSQLRFLSLP